MSELIFGYTELKIFTLTSGKALGCLLHALVFGKSPFEQAAQSGSVALAVMSAVRIPATGTLESIRVLLLQMLNMDCAARPFIGDVMESVRAILKELTKESVHSPVAVAPATAVSIPPTPSPVQAATLASKVEEGSV